jgi:hypothetical protein
MSILKIICTIVLLLGFYAFILAIIFRFPMEPMEYHDDEER